MVGNLNDLWKYSAGQWTWVSGSNVRGQSSTFGTEGTLDAAAAPGARSFLTHWTDPQGNLWLFGGYGQTLGALGNLNDCGCTCPRTGWGGMPISSERSIPH